MFHEFRCVTSAFRYIQMTQTSHVMGLRVYMICIQMCQVSKVHNCLENGQIIRVHICNGFSIPFFFSPQHREEIKKVYCFKNVFSFFFLLVCETCHSSLPAVHLAECYIISQRYIQRDAVNSKRLNNQW